MTAGFLAGMPALKRQWFALAESPFSTMGGPCVFRDDWRPEGFIKPGPATNFLMRLFPVQGRAKKWKKCAGLEGVEDGFFFGGNAGGREATVCPGGEAI